jgi:WD40 repeat protein
MGKEYILAMDDRICELAFAVLGHPFELRADEKTRTTLEYARDTIIASSGARPGPRCNAMEQLAFRYKKHDVVFSGSMSGDAHRIMQLAVTLYEIEIKNTERAKQKMSVELYARLQRWCDDGEGGLTKVEAERLYLEQYGLMPDELRHDEILGELCGRLARRRAMQAMSDAAEQVSRKRHAEAVDRRAKRAREAAAPLDWHEAEVKEEAVDEEDPCGADSRMSCARCLAPPVAGTRCEALCVITDERCNRPGKYSLTDSEGDRHMVCTEHRTERPRPPRARSVRPPASARARFGVYEWLMEGPVGIGGIASMVDEYGRGLDGRLLRTLRGHQFPVSDLAALPPEGPLGRGVLASASRDATVRLWDVVSGACLRTLAGHTDAVDAIAVLPGAGRLASGSYDKTVRVWDVVSGACLLTLAGHTRYVAALAALPPEEPHGHDTLASGSMDSTVRVWDPESGKCLHTLTGHTYGVQVLAVLPPEGPFGRSRLASGSHDKTVCVWDLVSGKCFRTLTGHQAAVRVLAVLPEGLLGRLASGSDDSTVRVWDVMTGKCLRTLEGHTDCVTTLAVLPGGKLASGSRDKTVRVWDVVSGACLTTLAGHTEWVTTLAALPDGTLASGARDKKVRVWDVHSGACLLTLAAHTGYLNNLAVLPDRRLASGSWDSTVCVWE